MNRLASVPLLLCAISVAAQNRSAGPLTVEVLSTRQLDHVTLTPLSPRNWIRTCESCPEVPVTAPITIRFDPNPATATRESRLAHSTFGGSFRVGDEAGEISADGIWKVRSTAGRLRVLLTIDSERYVTLALQGEAATGDPPESLKAMAVAIRTFALQNAPRHAKGGFDLCDSTHCQALRYQKPAPDIERAVLDTAGETLWFTGKRAAVFYTQNCGGTTEAARNLWPGVNALWLSEHADPWCVRRAPAVWHADVRIADLAPVFHAEGWKLPPSIQSVRILRRTAAGRAQSLQFSGQGAAATVSASSFRFAVDRAMGWNRLRSDWYSVSIDGATLHFTGRGYGHGVGLCQAGALQMATEGRSYREILAFYFPGTKIGVTPDDSGWRKAQENDLTLISVSDAPALRTAASAAWSGAQQLFPPQTRVDPVVRVFPTTELFREWSREPGWALAATRGSELSLQPPNVLAKRGNQSATLLHEFLHVLVENESSPATPLWLREGLVEALSEKSSPDESIPMSNIDPLDRALTHPATWDDAMRAHAQAAALVRTLISRYGIQQVRAWLRTGIPQDALMRLPQLHSPPRLNHP